MKKTDLFYSMMFLSVLGILLAGPYSLAAGSSGENDSPNIIYIMLDEIGYYELSCMGHPELQTPNLDRMAAEGMQFTNAYAGGCMCAPTRCSLLTGKHLGHASEDALR